MKAQTFKIMGSQSLLEAMWKELLSIGYRKVRDYSIEDIKYDNTCYICINNTHSPKFKDKDVFTYLYFGNLSGVKMNKHFNLPEQYNEALEFAKEQLKPKYWKEIFDFEIGKWYYFEAYKSKSKTFAKCKGIDATGFDCTDWIVNDTLYQNGRWCYENMHNVREATLEEIQQYLPDGHPDKKYIPKKGDYIYHDHGNYGWIVIFSEINKDYVIGEQCITGKNSNSFYMSYCNSNNNSELRPATQEEKQWLDACIKAGKFISKEEALETEEERLLKEAKRRYPVGTKFYPAHVPKDGDYCIVTNNIFEYGPNIDSIWSLTDEKEAYSSNPKYGNTGLNRNVYLEGKWAEIVPEVKKWDVGTYIVFIKNFGRSKVGNIDKITDSNIGTNGCLCEKELITTKDEEYVKWFATKKEAEEFAETLKIRRWSPGTYAVALYNSVNWTRTEKGDIYSILNTSEATNLTKNRILSFATREDSEIKEKERNFKWFSTLNEAEEFAKTLTSSIELPFGKTTWTINKGSRVVTSVYGKITFDETISLYEKIESFYEKIRTLQLLGHSLTIPTIKFGCQEGTFKQLEEIYNAIK